MMFLRFVCALNRRWSLIGMIGLLVLSACGDATATPAPATSAPAATTTHAAVATTASAPAATTAPAAATTSPAAVATTAPVATGPKVTLTFGWWSNSPEKDATYRKWLDSFQASHPNITITSEILPWGNYWDKVKTTTAAGSAYDIVGLCSCMSAPYFANDQFVDLNSFSDYAQVASTLQPEAVKLYSWGNKQYGLPVGLALSVLGYNKDLLTAAGIPLPDPSKPMSFDDFKAIAKKLTKTDASGKVIQYGFHPSDITNWENFVIMEGGQPYDNPIDPKKVTVNNPAGIQGLTDLQSLFTEKIAPPADELTGNVWGDGDLPSLQTGKIGFARLGPWTFADIMNKSPNIGVTVPFQIKQPGVYDGANGFGIFKGSQHPKEAWEFVKWAMQPENQLSFATFSDVPVNATALTKLDTVIKPKEFVPTLVGSLPSFKASVMTPHDELNTALTEIITDLERGKLTPTQAAAEMEQKGNAILGQ